MSVSIQKCQCFVIGHLKDSLFKNSFFILITLSSTAGFGFIFWVIAAKIYPPEEVGVATALISSMGLLIHLSRFGLDFSTIRFIPTKNKSDVFSTAVIVTTVLSFLIGVIYIAGIDLFSPELQILKSGPNSILFLVTLVINSLTTVAGVTFVSLRMAQYQFIQSLCNGSRILFLFPLVIFGTMGIFESVGLSSLLTFLLVFALLARIGIKTKFSIDKEFLIDSLHFSAGNYLAGIFILSPTMILPIIVLNILGAEEVAYYYMAYSIASLIHMIPNAMSTSLFVEGSYGEDLKKNVIKSLSIIVILLIPMIIIFLSFGRSLFGAINENYAIYSLKVFQIMTVASLFVAVNYMYYSINRVLNNIKSNIFISGTVFALLLSLSYIFGLMYGLTGVGYAWLVSYGVGTLLIVIDLWKKKWIHCYIPKWCD